MKITDLCQALSLDVRAAPQSLDREVTGGYASDLLSCVMARAQAGNVWVTMQGHPNIVAVDSLLDLAGVIVSQGMSIDAATIAKAEEEGLPILASTLTTYTLVGSLFDLGVPGVD